MLGEYEVRDLCRRLGCSADAPAVIAAIQTAPPTRRVSSRAGNVSVRYPSRKMGVVIQAESHRNELAAVYAMEHDPQVLAYYDQPPPLKLTYLARHGRRVGVLHTPDFFVIRVDSICWEEWKPAAELERLAEAMPARYVRTATGWSCPPGEEVAVTWGFAYHVRSSAEIDWVFQRNFQFLSDYLHTTCPPVDPAITAQALAEVSTQPGIALAELLVAERAWSNDQIYTLLAQEQLYVDLHAAPLAEPEQVRVFRDLLSAQAFALLHAPIVVGPAGLALPTGPADPEPRLAPAPDAVVEPVGGTPPTRDGQELLARATPAALAEANRRYALITPRVHGHATPAGGPPARTLRLWLAAYRAAEARYGAGYLGLLPRSAERGNRTSRLSAAAHQLLAEVITTWYETPTQPSKLAVYGRLLNACAERGLLAPSYATFASAIRNRPRYTQTLRRQGARAAYAQEPWYWELSLTTPRHGDRPFELAHLDHTELDLELVCARTGRPLGRPWLTLLVDAYSRRLLAFSLSFDPPSYRACMHILRRCVHRHGRLPQILVVDGGKEFASVYLETLLARYEVMKKTRPGAKPRFGSVIERLFGTTNTTFIYNLAGNTQLTRQVRQVTASVNPQHLARWSLEALDRAFQCWADEVYDLRDHPALGQSPQACFLAGLAQGGERCHRRIAYDDHFVMLTLPTTPRGVALVQPNQGVKVTSIYYWADAFRDPLVERTLVPVRYDPADVGLAYAFVQGRWVRCISEQYARLAGRSEREIQLASAELRRRQSQQAQRLPLRARQLAEFLVSLDAEEVLLEQRLRDLALRDVAGPVTHEAPAASPETPAPARPAPVVPDEPLSAYEEYL
jgi:putative transposase